jgi:hypothetical protein
LMLLGMVAPYWGGWWSGQNWRSDRQMGAYVLKTYPIQSDETIATYLDPNVPEVRELAAFLEENNLNVFSEPFLNTTTLIPSDAATDYRLDGVNGQLTLRNDSLVAINSSRVETITVTGWAVDKQGNGPARAVFVTLDGTLYIPTLYGEDRPDIASAYNNPNYKFSGFIATFSSTLLSKGVHAITLKIVSQDASHFYSTPQLAVLLIT